MDPATRPDVHRLRDLKFPATDTYLCDGELYPVGGCLDANTRLYVLRDPKIEKAGKFVAVQFVLAENMADQSVWDDADVYVSVLCEGWACFDGVRHLYWTPDSDCKPGYIYYPDLYAIAELMRLLEQVFPDQAYR